MSAMRNICVLLRVLLVAQEYELARKEIEEEKIKNRELERPVKGRREPHAGVRVYHLAAVVPGRGGHARDMIGALVGVHAQELRLEVQRKEARSLACQPRKLGRAQRVHEPAPTVANRRLQCLTK